MVHISLPFAHGHKGSAASSEDGSASDAAAAAGGSSPRSDDEHRLVGMAASMCTYCMLLCQSTEVLN